MADPRTEPVTQFIEESVFVRMYDIKTKGSQLLDEPGRKLAERAAFWKAYGWSEEPVQVVVAEDPMSLSATITLRQRLTRPTDG